MVQHMTRNPRLATLSNLYRTANPLQRQSALKRAMREFAALRGYITVGEYQAAVKLRTYAILVEDDTARRNRRYRADPESPRL